VRILAVDPGTTESAFVEWDGAIQAHGLLANSLLLPWIREEGVEVADILVLEKVESFGMPVGKEVFETVFWCGRFAEAWQGRFEQLSRRDVKLHICGHARATDSNIRQALIDRLGPIGTKKTPGPLYGVKGHEFSALAVAITYYDLHVGEIRPGVSAQF
jgi:hypothetical protein